MSILDMIKYKKCQPNPIFFNIPYFFPYLLLYRILDIDQIHFTILQHKEASKTMSHVDVQH
jgi:hypothetical protein